MLKRKKATIAINKKQVLDKVEAIAYKRVESSLANASIETQSALQADVSEELDAALLSGMLDSRDAEVRGKLIYCLDAAADSSDLVVSNVPSINEEYVYNINVPEDFTRDRLSMACSLINDYFVYATLHDWYIQHGVASTIDSSWLDSLLRKIASAFRFETFRKPLQPFGPAEPIVKKGFF